MGLSIGGFSLPNIKLPKFDLNTVSKKGVEILKTVAKDMFKPSADGKTIFNPELNYKVGPFDLRLKNPVEALAQKLLGSLSEKAKQYGFNTDLLGEMIAGKRDVKDVAGAVDMPKLPERTKDYAPKGGKEKTPAKGNDAAAVKGSPAAVGGGTTKSTSSTSKSTSTTSTSSTSKSSSTSSSSAAGADFASEALSKLGGTLNTLDKDIKDKLAAAGKDMTMQQQLELQQAMQRRNELFQLLSQIMNMEHETKRTIIGNIR